MNNNELKELTDKIEYLYLKTIAQAMKDNAVTLAFAKTTAQEFRALEPFGSVTDAQQKIAAYVAKFPLFATLKEYLDSYHNEKKLNVVIGKMQQYMKDHDIDAALEVAEKHNQKQE
ncbi:MAG: hypothetical protein WC775_05400 [Patescibacteria group bacterium]|jgi:hypothetical protein